MFLLLEWPVVLYHQKLEKRLENHLPLLRRLENHVVGESFATGDLGLVDLTFFCCFSSLFRKYIRCFLQSKVLLWTATTMLQRTMQQ